MEPATYREPAKPPAPAVQRKSWLCRIGIHETVRETPLWNPENGSRSCYGSACYTNSEAESCFDVCTSCGKRKRPRHAGKYDRGYHAEPRTRKASWNAIRAAAAQASLIGAVLAAVVFSGRWACTSIEDSQAKYRAEALAARQESWRLKVATCTQSCRALDARYVDLTVHGCFCARGDEHIALPSGE